jgi:hypothetical protein
MVSSCNSFEREQFEGDGSSGPIADYRETVALLQEEIARLELELRMCAATRTETSSNDQVVSEDQAEAPDAVENPGGAHEEVERFKAELASRDETIRLLLDEVSRVEEAQAATRAEWEQLAQWVSMLEHRVEGQDGDALHQVENRLAAEQQKADGLAMKLEHDRRTWEAQRQIFQAEIDRLQGTLDEIAKSPAAHDGRATQDPDLTSAAVEALRAENLRLRDAWQELMERNSAALGSESFDDRLAETVNERHQLRRQLVQIQDEQRRERLEHEATVAELQARLSQAALARSDGQPSEKVPGASATVLDIDLRIRALRQHFRETEELEKEDRRRKQLIGRLSRLWNRTGPR